MCMLTSCTMLLHIVIEWETSGSRRFIADLSMDSEPIQRALASHEGIPMLLFRSLVISIIDSALW